MFEVASRCLGWVLNAQNFVVSILRCVAEDINDISFYYLHFCSYTIDRKDFFSVIESLS
jgi:hypothetical protein